MINDKWNGDINWPSTTKICIKTRTAAAKLTAIKHILNTLLTTGFSLVMKYPHADAKAPTPPKPKARKDPSPNLISSVGSFF